MVVKTGIASANNCLPFFKKLTENKQWVNLFDFVNTRSLFPTVQTVERFSLITFKGRQGGIDSIKFATLCQDVSDLFEPGRQYTLSSMDLSLMSPVNGACPLLKGQRDGAIMKHIYRSFPTLAHKDLDPEKFWNLKYVRIFDMATDSHNFRRREDLEANGLVMDQQQRFIAPEEEYWPLYEGKYIYLFEHRYGSFENVPVNKRYGRKATAPSPIVTQLQDPYYEIVPRYWFPRSLWLKRCNAKNLREDYQFYFRDIAGVYPDLRTSIGGIGPAGPAGDKAPALILNSVGDKYMDAKRYLAFTAIFCSIPFDYIVRNKLFSKSLKFNVLGQIPMPPPGHVVAGNSSENTLQANLQKLALELSFTSWALLDLGEAVGQHSPFIWDEERRFLILREIDALAAHFYGLSQEELEYIISTFQSLERHDVSKYGSFRTGELILANYDRIQQSIDTGQPYETLLDPLPASFICTLPLKEKGEDRGFKEGVSNMDF